LAYGSEPEVKLPRGWRSEVDPFSPKR
jgi:hypothetical protein